MEAIQSIEQKLLSILEDYPDVFIVDMKIKPVNNFKLFLDADQGLSIETCAAINRKLYKQIEEASLFPNGDFSLEVSSPGLDEPLKNLRQYLKNKGRQVDVIVKDGIKYSGKLISANDHVIVLQETTGKGKKATVKEHEISMNQIKSTFVVVSF